MEYSPEVGMLFDYTEQMLFPEDAEPWIPPSPFPEFSEPAMVLEIAEPRTPPSRFPEHSEPLPFTEIAEPMTPPPMFLEHAEPGGGIDFLRDKELLLDAPYNVRWHEANPLVDLHIHLTSKITWFHKNLQLLLGLELNKVGWPLHLRFMETATRPLVPDSPWPQEDEAPLLLLRIMFKLPSKWIAYVFFFGRLPAECEVKLVELMGVEYEPVVGDGFRPLGIVCESEPQGIVFGDQPQGMASEIGDRPQERVFEIEDQPQDVAFGDEPEGTFENEPQGRVFETFENGEQDTVKLSARKESSRNIHKDTRYPKEPYGPLGSPFHNPVQPRRTNAFNRTAPNSLDTLLREKSARKYTAPHLQRNAAPDSVHAVLTTFRLPVRDPVAQHRSNMEP
jgi:hypothetical protein